MPLSDMLRALPASINAVYSSYHYDLAENGKVVTEAARLRILRAGCWAWTTWGLRCHEDPIPVPPAVPAPAAFTHFYIEHRPAQSTAERVARNEHLFQAALAMGTESWRLFYYLARTSEGRHRHAEALEYDRKAAAYAGNDDERYVTLHCMARLLRLLRRPTDALDFALKAFHVNPRRGEAMADLVHASTEIGDYARAILWYERLLELEAPDVHANIEQNAYETELWPHVSVSRAFFCAGRFAEARAAAARGVAFAPYDPDAQKALAAAEHALEREQAIAALRTLHGYALRHDEPGRARELLRMLPHTIEADPGVLSLVAETSAIAARATEAAIGTPGPTEEQELAEAFADAAGRRGGVFVAVGRELAAGDRPLREAQREADRVAVVVPSGSSGAPAANRSVFTPSRLHDLIEFRARRIERLEHVPPIDGDPGKGCVTAIYEPGLPSAPLKTVTFYCPCFVEHWGPWSPERTGIGASEEMVVLVARKLQAAGAQVEVFAPVRDLCVDRGVVWRPLAEFDHRAEVDVLVACRTAHLSQVHDLGAKKLVIWSQDAPGGDLNGLYAPECQARVAAYLFTSQHHADEYVAKSGIERAKAFVVPQAPEPEDVTVDWGTVARNPRRAVYASAPYRGLDKLLDIWPLVRELVPDAELSVCYGWQVHDALAKRHPQLAALKAKIEAHLKAPGVTWLDRIPSGKLRELFLSSGVFVYPSTFPEMACRALVRAQVLGCFPVYRPLAALAETARWGMAVEGEPGEGDYNARFAAEVARNMLAPPSVRDRQDYSLATVLAHDPWSTWFDVVGLGKRASRREEAHAR